MNCAKSLFLLCVLFLEGHNSMMPYEESYTLSEEFVERINREQQLWKAGRNFHEKSSLKHLISMLPEHEIFLETKDDDVKAAPSDLPEAFDSRTKWKLCRNIGTVADQGNCASGWAITPASVLSDRVCVSGGAAAVNVSAQHVLSCCKRCGAGCFGGYVTKALEFLRNHGAPTGSSVGTRGCQPYFVKKCKTIGSSSYCDRIRDPTPLCAAFRCTNRFYRADFGKDFHKAGEVYSLRSNVTDIQKEIYKNGPVLAVVDVYEDIFSYKYGVYRHVLGDRVGRQEVKIIGWGVERNTPYWTAVNTWGTNWGDGGVVKIAAGVNECNVEAHVIALRPKM